MAELKPPLQAHEASIEASRCLYCFDAPCIMACPSGIDIPTFIKKIAHDNPVGAARTILTANVLGASCARACPTEVLCEGACVLDDRDAKPIEIGRLQRYATDYITDRGISVLHPPGVTSNKSIAIIGAGPAGLSCAAELAQYGHKVVVFEKQPYAGGLNTYGIAYYKMKPEVSLHEVNLVRSLGVEIRCGVEVGRNIGIEDITSQFDAIFIGIGLGDAQRLRIPGEDLPEVRDALDFIEEIRTKPLGSVGVGRRVAVIGCGNTAIDAVTQSLRLGANEAFIVYRRGEEDMSAYSFEYDLAKSDGAKFMFHTAPVEAISRDGHVCGLRLVKTCVGAGGRVEIVPGSDHILDCDLVLKAVGQEKQASALKALFPSLEVDPRGVVVHNHLTGATNLPRVFVGGDCANGGREVVNAVGEGKKAARSIHALITNGPPTDLIQPSRLGVPHGLPSGSGINLPIRAHELEEAAKA